MTLKPDVAAKIRTERMNLQSAVYCKISEPHRDLFWLRTSSSYWVGAAIAVSEELESGVDEINP